MKNALLIAGAVAAFGFIIFQQIQLNALRQQATNAVAADTEEHHEEEEYELGEAMTKLHIYLNKLWFAGKNNNWELAAFYTHELEEGLESIVKAKVEEDGLNISQLAQAMTAQPLSALEEAVKAKDVALFEAKYVDLMNTCNACHQAAKHGFIRLKVPHTPMLDNQDFAPVSLKAKDAALFEAKHVALMNTCNACHQGNSGGKHSFARTNVSLTSTPNTQGAAPLAP